jgi:hypothetical protein
MLPSGEVHIPTRPSAFPQGDFFSKKHLVLAYPHLIRLDSRYIFGLSATTIRTFLAKNTGAFCAYPHERRWLELVSTIRTS